MPAQRISFLSLVGVASLAGLVLASCSTQAGGDGDEASTTVVATTTQIGSLVDQITECAGGEAQVLMSPGDDPHTFEASSTQIADMITADLVVTNGLGLEASMQRSVDNAKEDGAQIFEVGPQLDPLPAGEGHDHADDEHEHGSYDAHVWMDVSRMADGAKLIGERVAETTGDEAYQQCGEQLADQLDEVDNEIVGIIDELDVPHLVTDHAAYGYFADRYAVEISGVVVPGGSTDAEPSSHQLAELTDLLKDDDVDALVTSKANPNRMVTALSEETGGDIPVIELYENGTGESGSDAETYQDAMLYNAHALDEALN
ncbi:MAG TPA: metal ABC transporter substrate-binding protein [Candidatus Yaniella excrementigallinarum]|nr:metal ABC transporter substrate-binding protein [Candidatus Yaniella excrementigallinarum]